MTTLAEAEAAHWAAYSEFQFAQRDQYTVPFAAISGVASQIDPAIEALRATYLIALEAYNVAREADEAG